MVCPPRAQTTNSPSDSPERVIRNVVGFCVGSPGMCIVVGREVDSDDGGWRSVAILSRMGMMVPLRMVCFGRWVR